MNTTSKMIRRLTAICAAGAVFLGSLSGLSADEQAMLDGYREHISNLDSVAADSRTAATKVFDELVSDSQEDALTESLMALYPDYANAVAAADSSDVGESVNLLSTLVESKDNYLAADAAFYLARNLMNEERYEDALPLLNRVSDEFADYTLHGAGTKYFVGVAQAGQLKNKEAIQTFMEFLESNSTAPERLRVSAWRQVQQLQAVEEGKIQDIHQRMDYSRRKLQNQDTGDATQEEQGRIVKMLSKLIKEEEKKECSSNNSKKQQQKKQQQKKQQQAQNKPKPKESKSQKGGQSSNPNGKAIAKSNADEPASPWSRLRERSRDPANNAIKEKLPARYRDLIERYYEKANEAENK